MPTKILGDPDLTSGIMCLSHLFSFEWHLGIILPLSDKWSGGCLPVLKDHGRYWGKIAVFGDYLPWSVHRANGGDRSTFPAHSGRILDLKDRSPNAVAHFRNLIEPEIVSRVVVVTVPSHDPESPRGGLAMLGDAMAAVGRCTYAEGCLVRTHKIDKLARGGDRGKDVHLASVKVAKPSLIRGQYVLLLDDVTKTGHSLEACCELLLAAGAKSVECATIGKT